MAARRTDVRHSEYNWQMNWIRLNHEHADIGGETGTHSKWFASSRINLIRGHEHSWSYSKSMMCMTRAEAQHILLAGYALYAELTWTFTGVKWQGQKIQHSLDRIQGSELQIWHSICGILRNTTNNNLAEFSLKYDNFKWQQFLQHM